MRILVVYYSRDGTTRLAANELKRLLGAEIEEITEPRSRAGSVEWLLAGREAMTKATPQINPTAQDPSAYDLVVVGSPVWAWNMASPIRSYLTKMKEKLPNVAFFCTVGSDAGATLREMAEVAGKAPTATLTLFTQEVRKGAASEKLEAFTKSLTA